MYCWAMPYRNVALPDSFLYKTNKLKSKSGNGEAKIYVGPKNDYATKSFWGTGITSVTSLIFKKVELVYYLDRAINACVKNNGATWRGGAQLRFELKARRDELIRLPEQIEVKVRRDDDVGDDRLYFRAAHGLINSKTFDLVLRKIPLSETAYLRVSGSRPSVDAEILWAETEAEKVNALHVSDEDAVLDWILNDDGIDKTTKSALVQSRVGQGLFRKRLEDLDGVSCALTGISHPALLIASHIKPWAASTNEERLDPKNGLLLSANVDRLFDKGLISFASNGALLVSKRISDSDLYRCGIQSAMKLAVLVDARRGVYLAYHRQKYKF
jgi:hypothetical protein